MRLPCDLEACREAYLVCEYVAVGKDRKGLCCKKEGDEEVRGLLE